MSADLEELIGLSDTLLVMLRGRIVAELDPATRHARRARRVHDRRRTRPQATPHEGSGSFYALAAPVLAAVVVAGRASIALLLSGNNPIERLPRACGSSSTRPTRSSPSSTGPRRYYVAGVAVAIGFKMNLFNIGAEASTAWPRCWPPPPAPPSPCRRRSTSCSSSSSPWPSAAPGPPSPASSRYAGRQRGDLDDHAQLHRHRHHARSCSPTTCSDDKADEPRRRPSRCRRRAGCPTLNRLLGCSASTCPGHGPARASSVAIVVGVVFYLLVWRTRFGFDLRTTGANPAAARVGVNPKAMIIKTIMLSGAHRRAVGMGPLLSRPPPQVRRHVPRRPRLHRHRRRPARAQQPRRHRHRRVGVGRHRAGGAGARPVGHPPGDRPASCRARCCCRRSSPSSWCGARRGRRRRATPPPSSRPRPAAGRECRQGGRDGHGHSTARRSGLERRRAGRQPLAHVAVAGPGPCVLALLGIAVLAVARIVADADDLTAAPRSSPPSAPPPRSCSPASAASVASGPASSTSASRG